MDTIRGFYLIAPFDDPGKISETFKELVKLAATHDLLFNDSKICGILSPHQGNIYKTFIEVDRHIQFPGKFNIIEIKGGKHAVFKVKGDKTETIKAAQFFYRQWLPHSGYKIADVVGFELFSENPATAPYDQLEREIHVPVEPVRN